MGVPLSCSSVRILCSMVWRCLLSHWDCWPGTNASNHEPRLNLSSSSGLSQCSVTVTGSWRCTPPALWGRKLRGETPAQAELRASLPGSTHRIPFAVGMAVEATAHRCLPHSCQEQNWSSSSVKSFLWRGRGSYWKSWRGEAVK